MVQGLTSQPRWLVSALVGLLAIAVVVAGYFAWEHYRERYTVTETETGDTVTQIIAARLSATSSLRVAQLNGTVQSTAQDVRGFGMLKTDQVVKMPFAVDYLIDASQIGPDDIRWVPEARTLIVDAPDVSVGTPNVMEDQRSLVRTQGLYVTREAGEALARQVSQRANARARAEAQSPERMAQARENGRRALAELLGAPLESLGYGDAQVVVSFPYDRPSRLREQWDVTKSVDEVLANRQ